MENHRARVLELFQVPKPAPVSRLRRTTQYFSLSSPSTVDYRFAELDERDEWIRSKLVLEHGADMVEWFIEAIGDYYYNCLEGLFSIADLNSVIARTLKDLIPGEKTENTERLTRSIEYTTYEQQFGSFVLWNGKELRPVLRSCIREIRRDVLRISMERAGVSQFEMLGFRQEIEN